MRDSVTTDDDMNDSDKESKASLIIKEIQNVKMLPDSSRNRNYMRFHQLKNQGIR